MNVLWSPNAKYCQSKVLKYSTPPPEYFNICSWNWSDEPISQVDREGGTAAKPCRQQAIAAFLLVDLCRHFGGVVARKKGEGIFLV